MNDDTGAPDESPDEDLSLGVPVIDAPTAAESVTGQVPVISPPSRDRAREQRNQRHRNRNTARWLTAVGVIAAVGAAAALFIELGTDDPAPVDVSGASTTIRATTTVATTTSTTTTTLPENWVPFPEIPA